MLTVTILGTTACSSEKGISEKGIVDDLFRAALFEDYRTLQNLATFEFDRSQVLSYSIAGFDSEQTEEINLGDFVNELNEAIAAHADCMKKKFAHEHMHANSIKRTLERRHYRAKIEGVDAKVLSEWRKLVSEGRELIKHVSSARAKLNAQPGAIELSIAGQPLATGALDGTAVVVRKVARIDVQWIPPSGGNTFTRRLKLEITRVIRVGELRVSGRWIATSEKWD